MIDQQGRADPHQTSVAGLEWHYGIPREKFTGMRRESRFSVLPQSSVFLSGNKGKSFYEMKKREN
jgi:hypothetical protein